MSTADLLDDLIRSVLNDPLPEEAAPGWGDVLRRVPEARPRRRPRARSLVLAFAILAVVFVPPAIAFHRELTDWFFGTPAPESVADSFRRWDTILTNDHGHAFCCAMGPGFGVDAARARGLVELRTAAGTVRLWDAPRESGGVCWLFELEPLAGESKGTGGSCDSPDTSVGGGVDWIQVSALPGMRVLHARVADGDTAELRFPDGSTRPMQVVAGHAIATVEIASPPVALLEKDADGAVVRLLPVPGVAAVGTCPICDPGDHTVVVQSGATASHSTKPGSTKPDPTNKEQR